MELPYVPKNLKIQYLPFDHPWMQLAKEIRDKSTCLKQRTGAVVFSPEGVLVGKGNNTTINIPADGVCPRDRAGCKTGEGYELCDDVCQNGHAEQRAVANSGPVSGGFVVLYGHWWCCEPCCRAMEAADIKVVYLLEDSGPTTKWD